MPAPSCEDTAEEDVKLKQYISTQIDRVCQRQHAERERTLSIERRLTEVRSREQEQARKAIVLREQERLLRRHAEQHGLGDIFREEPLITDD